MASWRNGGNGGEGVGLQRCVGGSRVRLSCRVPRDGTRADRAWRAGETEAVMVSGVHVELSTESSSWRRVTGWML